MSLAGSGHGGAAGLCREDNPGGCAGGVPEGGYRGVRVEGKKVRKVAGTPEPVPGGRSGERF